MTEIPTYYFCIVLSTYTIPVEICSIVGENYYQQIVLLMRDSLWSLPLLKLMIKKSTRLNPWLRNPDLQASICCY